MQEIGRILIIIGLILALVGLILFIGSRLGLGRLPGDIAIHKGSMHIYIPLASCLLIIIVLSVLLWLFRK